MKMLIALRPKSKNKFKENQEVQKAAQLSQQVRKISCIRKGKRSVKLREIDQA